MSEMEYNRGKMIPVTVGEIVQDFPEVDLNDVEWDTDGKYINFMQNFYRVNFEVENGDLDEIARATEHDDGTISFETYHYNGGAHWTEVVESALKRKEK